MINRIRISRYLQIGLLLTFLLPFFPKGCRPSAEELEAQRITDSIGLAHRLAKVQIQQPMLADSINNKELSMDSLKHDYIFQKNSVDNESITIYGSNQSKQLSEYYSTLGIILRPNGDFSGIGYLLDWIVTYILIFGSITAFILLILGLIIKYKDFNNIFIFINIIALILLFLANPIMDLAKDESRLWGFWFCTLFGLFMIISDTILLIRIKKNKTGA
jgi:hypothetical protein